MKCVGCDAAIPWDGKGFFSYTCPCGATIFYDPETLALAMPASVIAALQCNRPIPHLDDLIGESAYSSKVKDMVKERLARKGAIWVKDCERCRQDGTYERRLKREMYLAVIEAERICRYEGGQGETT